MNSDTISGGGRVAVERLVGRLQPTMTVGSEIAIRGYCTLRVIALDFERSRLFPEAVAQVEVVGGINDLEGGTHVSTPWGYVMVVTAPPSKRQLPANAQVKPRLAEGEAVGLNRLLDDTGA